MNSISAYGVAVALAGVALLLPSAVRAAPTCAPRGVAETLVVTEHGRLFTKLRHYSSGPSREVAYGCINSTRTVRKLGYYGDSESRPTLPFVAPTSERLEGRFATWVRVERAPFDFRVTSEVLTELDLKTGAVVYRSSRSDAWGTSILARVQKANGSLAYVVNGSQVKRFDSGGEAVLDTDPKNRINGFYMKLSADRRSFTWQRDGAFFSAPID